MCGCQVPQKDIPFQLVIVRHMSQQQQKVCSQPLPPGALLCLVSHGLIIHARKYLCLKKLQSLY